MKRRLHTSISSVLPIIVCKHASTRIPSPSIRSNWKRGHTFRVLGFDQQDSQIVRLNGVQDRRIYCTSLVCSLHSCEPALVAFNTVSIFNASKVQRKYIIDRFFIRQELFFLSLDVFQSIKSHDQVSTRLITVWFVFVLSKEEVDFHVLFSNVLSYSHVLTKIH